MIELWCNPKTRTSNKLIYISVFISPHNKFLFILCRKYLFDIEHGQLRLIEESVPTSRVTSDIIFHPTGGAVFTLTDHFGAVMVIPQNTLQVWPGYSGSQSVDVAILPEHNMVKNFIDGIYFMFSNPMDLGRL